MRYLKIFTISICLLFSSIVLMADQSENEEAIRKVVERMNAAFDNHDAKGMAAYWDQFIESWDGKQKGAVQVAEYYADLFKRQPNIKCKLLEEIGIIFITPDVAVYKAHMSNTGQVDENGKPLPQSKWLGAWVMVKKNGKWLNAAFFSG